MSSVLDHMFIYNFLADPNAGKLIIIVILRTECLFQLFMTSQVDHQK